MCNFYVLRHFRIESHSYLHKRDTKIEICFFQLPGSVTFESWSILKKEKWNDRMVVVNDQSRKLLGYWCIRRGTRIYREVKSVNTLLERRQVTPPSPTSHRIEYLPPLWPVIKSVFLSLSPPLLSPIPPFYSTQFYWSSVSSVIALYFIFSRLIADTKGFLDRQRVT